MIIPICCEKNSILENITKYMWKSYGYLKTELCIYSPLKSKTLLHEDAKIKNTSNCILGLTHLCQTLIGTQRQSRARVYVYTLVLHLCSFTTTLPKMFSVNLTSNYSVLYPVTARPCGSGWRGSSCGQPMTVLLNLTPHSDQLQRLLQGKFASL